MSRIGSKLRSLEGDLLAFTCPGCETWHQVRVRSPLRPCWEWNGNGDKPTFSPSILVKGHDFTAKGRADYEVWRAAGFPAGDREFERAPTVCHSFINDGRIQFLSDCTHALAGQTVDLPDVDD